MSIVATRKPALHLDPDSPIAEKVRVLQSFLGEHYFDENGLMYAMWYWKGDELRPFVMEDFEGQAFPQLKSGELTPRGHQNYENSAWTSGIFLWSQCQRFRVTGDERALAYAAKAFRSIDHIFKMTEAAGHRGFLCKPWDAKISTNTSPDQYFAVMMGLWNYREFAPKETRQRIDYLIPTMADWWKSQNYKINFFDMDMSGVDRNDFHNPGMTAMNVMSFIITGDEKYQKEAFRMMGLLGSMATYYDLERERMFRTGTAHLDWYYSGFQYDPARKDYVLLDFESRGACWMATCALPFMFRHDFSRGNLFKHALYRYWRHMQYGMREDLLSYYTIQVDLERDTWHPVSLPPTEATLKDPPYGWHFMAYYNQVCWGDAVSRIPHVSVVAHQYSREFCPGALELAKRILRKLDDTRLKWFHDPDGKQLLPPDRWLNHVLSSDVPAFTCLSYWTARAAGIDLDA